MQKAEQNYKQRKKLDSINVQWRRAESNKSQKEKRKRKRNENTRSDNKKIKKKLKKIR